MAYLISISFKESEKELWEFLQKQIEEKKLSPTEFFKQNLRELMLLDQQFAKSNITSLKERLDSQHKIIEKAMRFIEEKGLSGDWSEEIK